jgi:hypothetical protein
MDDFGVKYIGKEHNTHLIKTLKKHYKVEEDWEGKQYLRILMDWDYNSREVHLSMLDYVECTLAQFRHPNPETPQHQPHQHAIPAYGATVQYVTPEDTLKRLSPAEKKINQEVIGVFLYYIGAADPTMLTALSTILSTQAKPMEDTMVHCKRSYTSRCHYNQKKRDVVIVEHSDASYLSEPKARSHAGRYFFMSSDVDDPTNKEGILNPKQLSRPLCPLLQRRS